MSYKTPAMAAVFAVATSPVFAQGFTGGTLGFEYQQALSDSSANGTVYFGEIEYGINQNFGIELDISGENNADSGTRTTLHGIYHVNSNASVGAYYTRIGIGSQTGSAYGLEGGTSYGNTNVAGYLGYIDIGSTDGLALGFNSETPFSNQLELFTDFNFVRGDSEWASNNKIGIQYNMNNGPELYANYGRLTAGTGGVAATGDYFGVGARINFGAARGTTFRSR